MVQNRGSLTSEGRSARDHSDLSNARAASSCSPRPKAIRAEVMILGVTPTTGIPRLRARAAYKSIQGHAARLFTESTAEGTAEHEPLRIALIKPVRLRQPTRAPLSAQD